MLDLTAVLKKAEIALLMDSKGVRRENVFIERLWRPIKYEKVYLHAYTGCLKPALASVDT